MTVDVISVCLFAMGRFGLDILDTNAYYSVFQFVSYFCNHISGVSLVYRNALFISAELVCKVGQ